MTSSDPHRDLKPQPQGQANWQKYKTLRALVVDHTDELRGTTLRMLKQFGIGSVSTASHSKEALSLASQQHYDLIISEYDLGKDITGLQLLDQLRDQQLLRVQDLFMIVSAENTKAVMVSAQDKQVSAFLSKPFPYQSLVEHLEKLLERREALLPVQQAIEDNELTQAVELCLSQQQQHPKHKYALNKLQAKLQVQLGHSDEAEKTCRDLLEKKPVEWARLLLAQILIEKDNLDEADELLDKVLSHNDLCSKAFDLKTQLLRQQKNTSALQSLLQTVASIATESMDRQHKLAEVAMHNNDIPGAAKAFQKAVRLSKNELNNPQKMHLDFSRCTCELLSIDNKQARHMTPQAIKSLEYVSLSNDDITEPNIEFQSQLLTSTLLYGAGQREKGKTLLEETEAKIDEMDIALDGHTLLDMAQANERMGNQKKADALVKQTSKDFADDPEVMARIRRYNDEAMSEEVLQQLSKLNKEGMKAFQNKQYTPAIQLFEEAMTLAPKHRAVAMNLALALVVKQEENNFDSDLMDRCLELFALHQYMPEEDEQYPRLKALREKAGVLRKKNKKA